jgi:hypothetical protein
MKHIDALTSCLCTGRMLNKAMKGGPYAPSIPDQVHETDEELRHVEHANRVTARMGWVPPNMPAKSPAKTDITNCVLVKGVEGNESSGSSTTAVLTVGGVAGSKSAVTTEASSTETLTVAAGQVSEGGVVQGVATMCPNSSIHNSLGMGRGCRGSILGEGGLG